MASSSRSNDEGCSIYNVNVPLTYVTVRTKARQTRLVNRTAALSVKPVELNFDEVEESELDKTIDALEEMPVRRGRGRPRKVISEAAAAAAEVEKKKPKKRGRPPKPKRPGRPPKAKNPEEEEEKAKKRPRGRPPKAGLKKGLEQERGSTNTRIIELETMVENLTQLLSDAESRLKKGVEDLTKMKDIQRINEPTFCINVKEVEDLRKWKEDNERKNTQTAATLEMKEKALAECKALYNQQLVLSKRYFNIIQDMKGKIRVYCRLRPLTPKEKSDGEKTAVTSADESTVELLGRDGKTVQHCYDRVFDENASQVDVFNDARHLVQSCVDGYNVCIFAYGQTGSGKTFTVIGTDNSPGLAPLASAELFQIVERDSNKFSFSLKAEGLHVGAVSRYIDGSFDTKATARAFKVRYYYA